jgi:hypothetical protein
MSDSEEAEPNITDFNSNSPYYHIKSIEEQNEQKFKGNLENDISDETRQTRPAQYGEDGMILFNNFNGSEITDIKPDTSIDPDTSIERYTDIDPYTMVITYKQDTKEKKSFIYNSVSSIDHLLSDYLKPFSDQEKQALARERVEAPLSQVSSYARARAQEERRRAGRAMSRLAREKEGNTSPSPSLASEAETLPHGNSLTGGKKYIARGGVGGGLVRRISASISNERARQTREGQPHYELHRSFFLIIWEHFAPNDDIRKRPREYKTRHFTIKLPVYKTDGTFACFVLLRCVTRDNHPVAGTTNIAYSVLFEFTSYIHWSIFYSFEVDRGDAPSINTGQVSELHFTLNQYRPPGGGVIPKTRMFFEYTDYINGLIRPVHDAMVVEARRARRIRVSFKTEQVPIMGIVSELMLLTMYQLATAKSYTTGNIFDNAALTMRQNIDSIGDLHDDNQLLKIALRHVDLIDCIQQEFGRHSLSLPSEDFINHLKEDIKETQTGGKNINRYLTKINNIKEKLKLLKKNKVKNKVKITKLSKLIEELKAKLKKQKEKDKAKLKKQKEKEKAKLKKQKEKEKAKLKKQKEKDNVKRKKTKAKKS